MAAISGGILEKGNEKTLLGGKRLEPLWNVPEDLVIFSASPGRLLRAKAAPLHRPVENTSTLD
jgi:hypothetical protein